VWLGPVAGTLVAVLALAYRTRAGHAFLLQYAITHPADRLTQTLFKLPLSMFAPAALLPFWFAVLQVTVVYAVAQATVGVARTAAVAFTGHALATVSDHLWILLGRPLGVGHSYDAFGDAGPSVAVVALLAYLATVRRVGMLVAVILAYDTMELAVFNGLSQREHLVGVVSGAAAGAAVWLLAHRKRRHPTAAAAGRPEWRTCPRRRA
jgi:hypothetical protein